MTSKDSVLATRCSPPSHTQIVYHIPIPYVGTEPCKTYDIGAYIYRYVYIYHQYIHAFFEVVVNK